MPVVGDPQEQPPKSKAAQLDDLFLALKNAKSPEAADAAENSISRLWLESGSDTVDLLMSWAMKAMKEKDYPLALDFLDRVTIMRPDYAEGWNTRATVYFLTEDYNKAIDDIRRVLALEPRHYGAIAGLGMIMRDIGEEQRAIELFEEALAIDPYLGDIKKALADLEAKAAGKQI